MNKNLFPVLLILFLPPLCVGAETVLVAPVIVYDKDSNAVTSGRNPSEEIYDRISDCRFEGMIDIRLLPSKKYGDIYTILDANRCCAAEGAEYILFGYVQKNEGSWAACLKLYDAGAKKTAKEFFSSDDITHYDRLLDDLGGKILTGLEDATGLGRDEVLNEKVRPLETRLPVSAFYWTPVDPGWNAVMLGIAGCGIGVEIYPRQMKLAIGHRTVDFSLRPQLSYSFAMGKDGAYPLYYSGISMGLPVCAHIHFDLKNSVYIGCGPYYEIELLNVMPKYGDQEFHFQNIFGLESFAGYGVNISGPIDLYAEVQLDFHFKNDTFLALRAALGLSVKLYKEGT